MLPPFLDKDEKSSVATIISIHGYYYCIIMWFVLFLVTSFKFKVTYIYISIYICIYLAHKFLLYLMYLH